MAHLGVYLTNDKGQELELPVAPADVMMTLGSNNTVVDLQKLGEVNLLGGDKLNDVKISSSFPVNPKTANYTTATSLKNSADDYINFIKNWRASKKAGRLTVSTTGINIRVSVEQFDYGFQGGNQDEYIFDLELKEWRDVTVKTVVITKPKPPAPPPRPAPPAKIGIGSTVIVNGYLYVDSYGNGRGLYEQNATRKINFMAAGRSKPYHVTLLNGGWRGWVDASAVRLA